MSVTFLGKKFDERDVRKAAIDGVVVSKVL